MSIANAFYFLQRAEQQVDRGIWILNQVEDDDVGKCADDDVRKCEEDDVRTCADEGVGKCAGEGATLRHPRPRSGIQVSAANAFGVLQSTA
ncbi:MAG: hypothetical protein KBT72_12645 [Zhongshania sp.]|jgi:hypothetical protein|nr:hypothetical protein [Zhongshania sp.]